MFNDLGDSGIPWRKCSDLGFITAVGVGDLLNCGHSIIVIVSGCGSLNIFNVFSDNDVENMDQEIKYENLIDHSVAWVLYHLNHLKTWGS